MPEPIRYEFIADTSKYDSNLKESDKWTLALDGSVQKLGKSIDSSFSSSVLKSTTAQYTVHIKNLNSELKKNIITAGSAQRQNAALLALRNKLTPTTKREAEQIDKINKKLAQNEVLIRRVSGAKNTATAANNKYNQSLASQSALLTQMQGQLANLFGIYAAQRFLKQMVKVRGEFELQSVALTAMLQDRKLADEMFAEVQALALKSPFKILELNSYLKQLKAYRIENEDLVGTLKQLGDISAGLGVDMSRLILAYGQVKAASVLRGQELRQFTEAGIPLVAQLADKFTELEGKVVSTADVFDRISKRQVSFEMIRDIFGEMTSEGGIFFNQQELQAGTLSGQISVLRDAFDKMLNAMGQANEGSLKGAIGVARSLVDNYEIVIDVLQTLIATYGAYRALLIADAVFQLRRVNTLKRLAVVLKRNAVAQKLLNSAMLKNPYILAGAVITGLVVGLYKLYKAQEKVNQQAVVTNRLNVETTRRVKQETTGARLLLEQLKATEKGSERRNALISEANSKYPDLLRNINAESASIIELDGAYSSFIDTVEQGIRMDVILEDIKETISSISELQDELEKEQKILESKKTQTVYTDFNKGRREGLEDELSGEREVLKILERAALFQEDRLKFGKDVAVVSEKIRDVNEEVLKATITLNAAKKTSAILDSQAEYFKGSALEITESEIKAQQQLNDKIKEQKKLQAELAELLRIKDDTWAQWRRDVNNIVESGSNTFDFKVKSDDVAYQDYVDELRKSHTNLLKQIKDINIENAKNKGDVTLIEQYEKLNEELATTEAIRRRLGFLWKEDKGSSDLFKSEKDNLKLLEEIRQTYLKLGDITKDTSLFEVGGDEFKDELEKIFKDPAYKKLLESYTDEDFKKYLEGLLKKAKDAGGKYGDAFADFLRIKIAEIQKEDILDEKKVEAEIEKLRNKLLGSASPFGEGIVFDISLITTKAENDVRKIAKEYDKAMKGANEQQKQALTELRDREIKGIREVSDERISSLVEGSVKKELGVLEQFYSNINEATLSQIKQVDDAIQKLAETPLDPIKLISPEELETLNKAGVELEVIFEDIRSGVPDEELKEIFGLTEDQLKVLKKVDATTQKWNSTMESVVTKWNDLEAEEKLQRIGEAISEIGDAATQLGSAISAMDDELGSVLSGLGQAASIIGNITVGVATGNPAAVAAGVIQGITAIISATAREAEAWKAAQEELRRQLAASRRDFNLYVNEVIRGTRYISNSLGQLEETQSIFDVENPYSEAIAGVNALNDATKLLTGSTNEWSVSVSTAMGDIDVATFTTSLEDALNVLGRVQTGNEKYGGFLGIGEKTRATYSSLAEVLGVDQIDIFSKEQLNEAIANYDLLDEKTKELVDDWKEYASAADEALEQTNQNLRDLTSGVVTDFSTALIDGFVNATDAAEGLKGSVEDIIEAMLQQMLVSTLLAPVFDDLQRRFRSSLGLNPDGSIPDNFAGFQNAPDLAKDVGEWWEDLGVNDLIENSYDWLSDVQNQFKEFNLDIFQPDAADDSGLARGIQSITEDTANIIAAYLNTIRHQVILNTGYMEQMVAAMQASQGIASAQLAQLSIISSNTGRVADLLEAVASGNRTLKVA